MIGLDLGALVAVLVVGVLALALPIALIWGLFKLLMGVFWLIGTVVGGLGKGIAGLFRGVGHAIAHCYRFVRDELRDTLRLAGTLLAAVVVSALAGLNVVLGRWATANHYGRAVEEEYRGAALALYRLVIGNPARLLGLSDVTEGLERRLPEVIARAPRGDRPRKLREFEGYKVIDTLPRGGSGAWLFLAEASAAKRDFFRRAGQPEHELVVLKSFSLDEGSTMPQIVRESRALEAAREMGLVLDHELTDERFFYAMPYVPGHDLGAVTRRLHERSGPEGLDVEGLAAVMAFATDVLGSLEDFHGKGLWHKDIKPSNVIVSSQGDGGERAHLVDLGLVTPLRSAMTLTTHGTEYFRDPEMVRLALQGVKVQEVDGVKFDVYSVGALLYSMLENSFPAHGSLSRVTKRCPETLSWIVRRAMAEMGQRYASADEMLGDLRAVMAAPDAYALKPAALPSMGGDVVLAGLGEIERPPMGEPPLRSFNAPFPSSPLEVGEQEAREKARRRRKRQGVKAGVLAAVAVLALLIFASLGLFMLSPMGPDSGGRGSSGVVTVESFQGPRRVWNSDELSVEPASAPLPENTTARLWTEREIRDLAPRFSSVLGSDTEHFATWLDRLNRVLDVPEERGAESRRVLVIDDLAPGSDPALLGNVYHALQERQIGVLDRASAFSDEELNLIAEAEALVGLSDLMDEEVAELLEHLVAERQELDGVLWLGDQNASASGAVPYRLILPGDELLAPLAEFQLTSSDSN